MIKSRVNPFPAHKSADFELMSNLLCQTFLVPPRTPGGRIQDSNFHDLHITSLLAGKGLNKYPKYPQSRELKQTER